MTPPKLKNSITNKQGNMTPPKLKNSITTTVMTMKWMKSQRIKNMIIKNDQ
jgi:hypothetical protein